MGALLKCWALPQLPHGIAVALLVTGVGGELSATRVLAVISFLPFECDNGTSMANGSLVHFASKLSMVATIRGFVQEYFSRRCVRRILRREQIHGYHDV